MKTALSVLLLVISMSNVHSQVTLDSIAHGWNITFSPSAFVNTFSGIQFGLERDFSNNSFLELEFAHIPKQSSNIELYKAGKRVKLGYKKYLGNNVIMAFTLFYRKTEHEFEKQEVLRHGAFYQEIDYYKTKTLIGPTFGYGYLWPIGTSRFSFEMIFNYGIGFYAVRNFDFPTDAEDFSEGRFLSNGYHAEGNYAYFILGTSLKLKYNLIKKSNLNQKKLKSRSLF